MALLLAGKSCGRETNLQIYWNEQKEEQKNALENGYKNILY